MKSLTVLLLIAILLPQATLAGDKFDSYQFAGIPWDTNLEETVSSLEDKGYTISSTEIPPDGVNSEAFNPDIPAHLFEKDFLNKYPANIAVFGNDQGNLWKIRIDIHSRSDLRDSIIEGILKKKYGRPKSNEAQSEIGASSTYTGEWTNSDDDSEIRVDCRWTKNNGKKEQHLVIIYQKADLVERTISPLDF